MNRRQPHPNDFHHSYPSTSRGFGPKVHHDFCTTDPKDHPEGIIYCDLNRPVLPPPIQYFPPPPPPYQPFPNHPPQHHHPNSFHTQPQILHALLTAPPPPPAFILPSPPVPFSGPGSLPLSAPPPYYATTTNLNISPHSSVSSNPNYSPQSSVNLSSSDNENEEYLSQNQNYIQPPPEKRLKLSTDAENGEVGFYSNPSPTHSRSLASTPELYIDESVHVEDGNGKEESCPCPYGQPGSYQEFQNSIPPDEPASPPPPMLVASHKKFHYKTWASTSGSNMPRPQYTRCYSGNGSSLSNDSFPSEEPTPYEIHKLKQSSTYEPDAHQFRASASQNQTQEDGPFSTVFMAGEMYRQKQHLGRMTTTMTSSGDDCSDNGQSVFVGEKMHENAKAEVKVEKNDKTGASSDDNVGDQNDDSGSGSSPDSDEVMDLFKELEEFMEAREKMAKGNGGVFNDAEGFGGHVSVEALVEMMDCVVGDLGNMNN